MNTQPYYITDAQQAVLAGFMSRGDRTGFYVALHEMTGSQSALDMAEISSSSGLRGGAAWLVNTLYSETLSAYPVAGVEAFSVRVAQGDFKLIHKDAGQTLWTVPPDLDMYKGARATWNKVGEEQGDPNFGDKYFPGNMFLLEHYMERGDVADAKQYFSPEMVGATLVALASGAAETLTEVVADSYNYTKSLNDFQRDNPGAIYHTTTSAWGAHYTTVQDPTTGKTIGVIRTDGPLGFVGKYADSLQQLLSPATGWLNQLGGNIGSALADAASSAQSGQAPLLKTIEGLFNGSLQTISPLELDLTGNGVQTINQSAGVHFDYTGSGFAQATGWSAPQDGLLVLPDANGQVTKGSQLFGNNTVLPDGTLAPNGFAALAALDSNHDGVIDAKDPAFAKLRLWVGGNGQAGSGQLLTLAQAGIQSLNVGYTTQNFTDANGNQIRQVGSYTLTNGTTRAMDDVWYSVNKAETVDVSTPVAVSSTIAALPNLSGAGNVHGLQQAMARDTSGKLAGLVQAFVAAAGTMTLAQARSAAEAILLDWTGADRYTTTSRGTYIDGREVYALEAFMGQGFTQYGGTNAGTNQPGPTTAAALQQAYSKLLDWTTAQLLAQTKFAPWLNQMSMTWNATTQTVALDVSKIVTTLKGLYTANPAQGTAWINEFAQSLKGMGETGAQILGSLHQQGSLTGTGFSLALATMGYTTVMGNAQTGVLNGVQNQDTMLVGVNGEYVIAGNGDDVLVAGGGQETFRSGSGNDTFLFNKGSGQLFLNDAYVAKVATANQDVLRLGAGITPAGTTISRDLSNNLILAFGNGDQVTIAGYFVNGANDPAIVFTDGTTWHATDLVSRAPLVDTTIGHQILVGATGLNDTIVGGAYDTIYAGNQTDTITFGKGDTVYAGAGTDTFVFNKGTGAVTLNDPNGSKAAGSNQDVLKLGAGITTAGTQLIRDLSNNLILNVGNGDQVTLAGYFNQTGNLPTVTFADGTTWNLAALAANLPLKDTTTGGHTLTGATGINDTIVAAAGDTVYAGNLNDTITAAKNSVLNSGAGIDTFVYNKGTGAVTLNDAYATKTTGKNQDVLKLGAGITAAGTQITRDLSNNLVLTFGNGDQVTVQGYFNNSANDPTITFADGTTWSFATVASKLVFTDTTAGGNSLRGLSGVNNAIVGAANDTIQAGNLNDTITAGKNNLLYAGAGVDTFIYNKGCGAVTLNDTYTTKTTGTNQDVLQLGAGITPAGTQLTRDLSKNLILTFGNGDQVTLVGYFGNTASDPTVVFADGTRWNVTAVASRLVFQDTTSGGNTLNGANGINNTIIGAANDTITAGNLNDTITAGKNNTLNAGVGVDTFLYNKGSGLVVLNESWSKTAGTNQDVVKLGAGLTAAATQITRDLSNNLVLGFGNGDQIRITGYFNSALNQPSIAFADGTTWNYTAVTNQLVFTDTSAGGNYLYGLTGVNNRIVGSINDTITAGNLNDTLTAGKNNTLYAGTGVDTFVFNQGAGAVTVSEGYVTKTAGKNQDVLKLGAGITAAATKITRDLSNNLVLGFGSGDQVTIASYFSYPANDPTVVFQDGTTWNFATVASKLVFTDTSAGGNWLSGLNGVNNTIVGAANDTIQAGNLNDTITTGKNDTLYAGAGVDTFVFNKGSGAVTLIENWGKTAGKNQDVVKLGAGITAATTQIVRDLSNNLVLGFGNGDQIQINGYFNNTLSQPSIVFADGTTWNYTSITSQLVFTDTSAGGNYLIGLTGVNNRMVGALNDTIIAGNLNDTITAAKGDTLNAGAGVDTFKVAPGTGAVTINEATKTTGKNQDVLQFTGVTANQLWFRTVGSALEIDVLGTTDHVTINNWTWNSATHLGQIQTSDAAMSSVDASVAQLVQAMASFGVPPSAQTGYTAAEQKAFAPLLASSWHH